MGRHWIGLALVVVVLLAAVTVPAVAGRRIVGNAVALVIPAAPQVGDCLLAVLPDPPSVAGADPAPFSVPCSAAHEGEIITQTVTVMGDSTGKKGGGVIPNVDACANTAYWYFGVHPPDRAGERSTVLGRWWPAFSAKFQALYPSALQLRIGQSWAACVMISPHGSIIGSPAHVFGGPPRPSPIALCTPHTEVVLDVSVPCDQPHPTEILGWRVADEDTAALRSFDQSCAELAARITGMADPTARGALRLVVHYLRVTDGAVHEGWGPGRGGPYRAACTIGTVTARLLTGSLTGLGNAPVPWE